MAQQAREMNFKLVFLPSSNTFDAFCLSSLNTDLTSWGIPSYRARKIGVTHRFEPEVDSHTYAHVRS